MNTSEREKWLKERTTGIGGSDASVILGTNPWRSKLELWTEKTSGIVAEKDSVDFAFGKLLEPVIADEYERQTGRVLVIVPERIVSKDNPFMFANVDRLITRAKDKKDVGILEIKTKGAYVSWDSIIPDYYMSQIQHYMAVTGHAWGSFAVLDLGKKEIIIHDVERDDEFIKKLIEEERKFWTLVQNKIPPKVDSSDACERFLKEAYTKENKDKTIDLRDNDDFNDWAMVLKLTREQMEPLKERESLCKNNLMSMIGDAEKAIGKDCVITWKSPVDKLIFNVEEFKKIHPSLYDEFVELKPQSRRFTIKFNKSE